MPRFYFHVRNGGEIKDEEGLELSGLGEAREQAVIASGEAVTDLGKKFWDSGEEWQMDVEDETGATGALSHSRQSAGSSWCSLLKRLLLGDRAAPRGG